MTKSLGSPRGIRSSREFCKMLKDFSEQFFLVEQSLFQTVSNLAANICENYWKVAFFSLDPPIAQLIWAFMRCWVLLSKDSPDLCLPPTTDYVRLW